MQRSEEFTKKYLTLQECYLSSLRGKLDSIDKSWSVLNTVNWSFEQFEKMQSSVHQLAGSAGGFGLKTLSKEAQALDGIIFECLQNNRVPDFHSKGKVSTCIKKMYESAGIVNDLEVVHEDTSYAGKKILVIDDDYAQTSLIELLCIQLQCKVKTIHNLSSTASAIESFDPDIILMDVVFPEGQFAGIDAINHIHHDLGVNTPVIFMSSRSDLSARLKSYRAGGSGYLTKPFAQTELLIQIDLLLKKNTHHERVLIIDKEENANKDLIEFLTQEGFKCAYSSNPAVIIHMLERNTPDILVLDLDNHSRYSDEILKVLRQEAKYMSLPILQITKNKNSILNDLATAHGANGILHKPINNELLLKSIATLIKKSTLIDSIKDRVLVNSSSDYSVTRSFFYSSIEKCILSDNTESATLLVCITFRNVEKFIQKTGLIRVEEVNDQIIEQLNQYIDNNEKLTKISDLHFALLLKPTDQTAIDKKLLSIKTTLDQFSFKFHDNCIHLDTNCCAVALSDHYESVDAVFKHTGSMAFDLLKSSQRSIYIDYDQQQKKQLNYEKIAQTIDYALENRTLFLSYQPIIDTNGDEKMFEGFSRLCDSEGNTIQPNDFLEHIDNDTIKEAFNRAVVQAAIDDLSKLRGLEAEEVEIIVKLLVLEKSPIPFLSWVSNIIRASRIRGKNRIIFSISEEDALLHPDKIEALHQGVTDLSCRFLLDHAGVSPETQNIIDTGRFEYVKLSANTVAGIKEGLSEDKTFVASLLRQNLFVIAPFIEDNQMFSALWKNGIRYFQGYFVRRPEPTLEFDFRFEQVNEQ